MPASVSQHEPKIPEKRLRRRLYILTSRYPRVVLAVWIIVVTGAIPLASHKADHLILGGFPTAGSQSARVSTTITKEFPQVSRNSLAVLLAPRRGATGKTLSIAIDRIARALRGVRGVSLSKNVISGALFDAGLLETTVLPLEVSLDGAETQQLVERLRRQFDVSNDQHRPIEVHFLGERAFAASLDDASKQQLTKAETIGFPVVLIVLVAIFGSIIAALVPIALAITALIATGSVIYLLSSVMQLSVFITNTASLIGIGVAVDYSLIILARFRQELARGQTNDDARDIAMMTAGRTVLFSGITVIASLSGLWVIPNTTLRSMALGAIIVVAVAVVASLTLLPALIGIFGARRLASQTLMERVRERARLRAHGDGWAAWTRLVTRHPWRVISTAGVSLLLLCSPVLDMNTASGPLGQLRPDDETRVGYDEAAKLVGPGSLAPIHITMRWTGNSSRTAAKNELARARNVVTRHHDVLRVSSAQMSHDGRYAFLEAVPKTGPESSTTKRLIQTLRSSLARSVGRDTSIAVGGATATLLDEEHAVATNMWKVIATVLAMAFIVLLILLRSVILPLKAVAMNLVSVGCAYGTLVVVFQWGWLDRVTGYKAPGHLNTLTPPLILAIVFGLSMDYEVFLLSRIREYWLGSRNASDAVTRGLLASAKTISSAALILMCVFAVFIGTGLPAIKEVGLGVAVAIGVDASVIRLALVPAILILLGDASWWVPSRLTRIASSASTRSVPAPAQADPETVDA